MKRYSQTYSFLDIDNPEEILILSTDYMRTIQSGYSEMMGMFPPNTELSQNLTSTQLENMETSGLGLPPFTIRNATAVN